MNVREQAIGILFKNAYSRALDLMESGSSHGDVLKFLADTNDQIGASDTVTSILRVGRSGLLHDGASPRLPSDYLKAIDGLKPSPYVGTCAAAVATRSMVITLDFLEDSKWAELRHLPLALGFKSAFSIPIMSLEGRVLGTFGTYFKNKTASDNGGNRRCQNSKRSCCASPRKTLIFILLQT